MPVASAADLSVDAFALAMRTTFDPAAAADQLTLTVADGRLRHVRGVAAEPDAVIETSAAGLRSLIFRTRKTDATVRGDRRAAVRPLRVFPRPVPA